MLRATHRRTPEVHVTAVMGSTANYVSCWHAQIPEAKQRSTHVAGFSQLS